MDMDMTHMQAFDMTDPAVHNYVTQMCEEVHFYGSKILLSQNLVYPDGYTLNGGRAFGPHAKGDTQPIPVDMIPKMIQDNVSEIRRYRNLGYDGINCRCDLVLCPSARERQDEYGGSVENRTRLLHEFFRELKRQLGRDFLISATVAWEQPNGYGSNLKAGAGNLEVCNREAFARASIL